MNTLWSQVTWDAARASGFTAYMLVTVTVVLGLLLSLRWQSKRWPRLVTNDMHNHLALLAMAFGVVHGIASWLDPFMQFRLPELLVPLASHYRPLWMAFGIVAFDLLVAVLLSTWLRPRIGYRLWRAFHGVAFLVFAFATVHGLGTGSDTRTGWATAMYGASALAVLGLTTWRLVVPAGTRARPRPVVAGLGIAAAAVLAVWAAGGPLRPGWNRVANDGKGSGARIVLATRRTPIAAPPLPRRFTATFRGTLTTGGSFQAAQATIRGHLTGAARGDLQILLAGVPTDGGTIAVQRSQVTLYGADGGAQYVGTLTGASGQALTARLTPIDGSGPALSLTVNWSLNGSAVSGSVTAAPAPAAGAATSPAGGGDAERHHRGFGDDG